MSMPENVNHFILLPAFAKRNYAELVAAQPAFVEESNKAGHNTYVRGTKPEKAILTTGIAYNYLMENYPDGCPYPVLKVTRYPFPTGLLKRLTETCKTILVIEEGQPRVEERLRGLLYDDVMRTGIAV